MTALHKAAQNGHTEVVKLLLDKGADINVKNEVSYTAFTTFRLRSRSFVIGHESIIIIIMRIMTKI